MNNLSYESNTIPLVNHVLGHLSNMNL